MKNKLLLDQFQRYAAIHTDSLTGARIKGFIARKRLEREIGKTKLIKFIGRLLTRISVK